MFSFLDTFARSWLHWRRHREMLRPKQDSTLIQNMVYTKDALTLTAICPNVVLLADEAVHLLQKYDAENYVSFDMMPSVEHGNIWIRVTVQYAHGESPGARIARLEAELARFKAPAVVEGGLRDAYFD